MTVDELIEAHDGCNDNKDIISKSNICECFYCKQTFLPTEIKEWVGTKDRALCPKCGIDSVIGSASGYDITSDFLENMYEYWFTVVIDGKIIKI